MILNHIKEQMVGTTHEHSFLKAWELGSHFWESSYDKRVGDLISQAPAGRTLPVTGGTQGSPGSGPALRWLPWSWWWWRRICCQPCLNSQSGSPSWWTSWSWRWSCHSPPRLCCPGCCWPSCWAQTAVVRSALFSPVLGTGGRCPVKEKSWDGFESGYWQPEHHPLKVRVPCEHTWYHLDNKEPPWGQDTTMFCTLTSDFLWLDSLADVLELFSQRTSPPFFFFF